jgi:hypothetical protein
MLAPPKPPPDPEALIPEARERQRRRQLVIAAAIAVTAGLGLAVYAPFGGLGQKRAVDGSPGAGVPLCRGSQLSALPYATAMGAGPLEVQYQLVNRSGSSCALPADLPTVAFAVNGKTVPTTQHLYPRPYTGFGPRAGRVLAPGRSDYYLVVFGNLCHPERIPGPRGTATVSLRFGDGLLLSATETTPENNGFPIVPACSGRNVAVSPLLRYG